MTERETCKTCLYWSLQFTECRRRSPSVGQDRRFPLAMDYDWCGEHKPNQIKEAALAELEDVRKFLDTFRAHFGLDDD